VNFFLFGADLDKKVLTNGIKPLHFSWQESCFKIEFIFWKSRKIWQRIFSWEIQFIIRRETLFFKKKISFSPDQRIPENLWIILKKNFSLKILFLLLSFLNFSQKYFFGRWKKWQRPLKISSEHKKPFDHTSYFVLFYIQKNHHRTS